MFVDSFYSSYIIFQQYRIFLSDLCEILRQPKAKLVFAVFNVKGAVMKITNISEI